MALRWVVKVDGEHGRCGTGIRHTIVRAQLPVKLKKTDGTDRLSFEVGCGGGFIPYLRNTV
jgi:hypothetical protein